MQPAEPERPAFDSVEKALVFAFNTTEEVQVASPLMNTAMAEVKLPSKAPKQEQESESGPKPTRPPVQPGERLRGLNRVMQSAMMLQVIMRLDRHHIHLLSARYTHPTFPCQCQSPCCQGIRPTLRWVKSIGILCDIVRDDADIVPLKKGYSTTPELRRLIVERYFLAEKASNLWIARKAKVSNITVGKHTELIEDYLDREETEALEQVALLFDQEGITGLLI